MGSALAGHVNTMKTPLVTTLLLLGMLASAGTALADPIDDAVAAATCVASIAGPDGQEERVRNVHLHVDVIDQHPECLN